MRYIKLIKRGGNVVIEAQGRGKGGGGGGRYQHMSAGRGRGAGECGLPYDHIPSQTKIITASNNADFICVEFVRTDLKTRG